MKIVKCLTHKKVLGWRTNTSTNMNLIVFCNVQFMSSVFQESDMVFLKTSLYVVAYPYVTSHHDHRYLQSESSSRTCFVDNMWHHCCERHQVRKFQVYLNWVLPNYGQWLATVSSLVGTCASRVTSWKKSVTAFSTEVLGRDGWNHGTKPVTA
jgi:hypothetical protein